MNIAPPPIRFLSLETIALIAAGEVIQHPKDVIKELVENALDAGASQIEIDLVQGGIEKIVVQDNGRGILSADLPLAIERHATSKIESAHELYSLNTFGFRGEALFAIASVCDLVIRSYPVVQEQGMQLSREPKTHAWLCEPVSMSHGTQIICQRLFSSLPVRRHFLKSPRMEAQRCEELVRSFALAHPAVAFKLIHNNELVCCYMAQEKLGRIASIFGRPQGWESIREPFDLGVMQVWYHAHHTKGLEQYWVINQRIVQDPVLKKLASSFFQEGVLMVDLALKPSTVDINIHPQKLQVGFSSQEGLLAVLADIFGRLGSCQGQNEVSSLSDISHSNYFRPKSLLTPFPKKTFQASFKRDSIVIPEQVKVNFLSGELGFFSDNTTVYPFCTNHLLKLWVLVKRHMQSLLKPILVSEEKQYRLRSYPFVIEQGYIKQAPDLIDPFKLDILLEALENSSQDWPWYECILSEQLARIGAQELFLCAKDYGLIPTQYTHAQMSAILLSPLQESKNES